MTHVDPVLQETDLVGTLTAPLSTTGTSATAIFIDKKTGAARTPQSTTLYFTINKGNSKAEVIQCDSHSTASGVTTLTINGTTGRTVPKYGSGTGTTVGGSHDAGDEIGCVDVAYPHNVHANVLNGTNATGAANFRVGTEAAADQTLHFATDATTDPKIYWDDSDSRFKISWGDDAPAAGDLEIGCPALTTTERDARTWPDSGPIIVNTTDGVGQVRVGGAWVDTGTSGTFVNASATVAGKVELAIQAENDAGTATGATGASLSATPAINAATIQKASWIYAADSGAANAYVVTLAPVPAAYTTGMMIAVKISAANTAASTINVNSLGAKNIYFKGAALSGGELVTGDIVWLAYDGTQFQLLSPKYDAQLLKAYTSGEAIAVGKACYLKASDGKAWKLNTTSEGEAAQAFIGFSQTATTGADQQFLINPLYDNNQTGLTAGTSIFGTNTAGTVTHTPGTVEKRLGRAVSATSVISDYTTRIARGTITTPTDNTNGTVAVALGFRPQRLLLQGRAQAYQCDDGGVNCRSKCDQRWIEIVDGGILGQQYYIAVSAGSYPGIDATVFPTFSTDAAFVATVTDGGAGNTCTCTATFSITDTGFQYVYDLRSSDAAHLGSARLDSFSWIAQG